MLKWVKQPKVELGGLDKIQILPNEQQTSAKAKAGALSEQEWYEANRHRLNLTNLINNINARKDFSWAIFYMVCVWLLAILTIVFLTGTTTLHLSASVLITLIGSGSINVISLFSYVAKYLYHVPETPSLPITVDAEQAPSPSDEKTEKEEE